MFPEKFRPSDVFSSPLETAKNIQKQIKDKTSELQGRKILLEKTPLQKAVRIFTLGITYPGKSDRKSQKKLLQNEVKHFLNDVTMKGMEFNVRDLKNRLNDSKGNMSFKQYKEFEEEIVIYETTIKSLELLASSLKKTDKASFVNLLNDFNTIKDTFKTQQRPIAPPPPPQAKPQQASQRQQGQQFRPPQARVPPQPSGQPAILQQGNAPPPLPRRPGQQAAQPPPQPQASKAPPTPPKVGFVPKQEQQGQAPMSQQPQQTKNPPPTPTKVMRQPQGGQQQAKAAAKPLPPLPQSIVAPQRPESRPLKAPLTSKLPSAPPPSTSPPAVPARPALPTVQLSTERAKALAPLTTELIRTEETFLIKVQNAMILWGTLGEKFEGDELVAKINTKLEEAEESITQMSRAFKELEELPTQERQKEMVGIYLSDNFTHYNELLTDISILYNQVKRDPKYKEAAQNAKEELVFQNFRTGSKESLHLANAWVRQEINLDSLVFRRGNHIGIAKDLATEYPQLVPRMRRLNNLFEARESLDALKARGGADAEKAFVKAVLKDRFDLQELASEKALILKHYNTHATTLFKEISNDAKRLQKEISRFKKEKQSLDAKGSVAAERKNSLRQQQADLKALVAFGKDNKIVNSQILAAEKQIATIDLLLK